MIIEKLMKIALLGSEWVLYLLLALSVWSVATMVERFVYFFRLRGEAGTIRQAIDETLISGSDVPPPHYEQPRGFEIMIEPEDPNDAERIFHALAENGTVAMPIQETFWSVRFGVLVDQFGIRWSVNCEKSPEPAG